MSDELIAVKIVIVLSHEAEQGRVCVLKWAADCCNIVLGEQLAGVAAYLAQEQLFIVFFFF